MGAGHASDTDSALEDSASDSDSEAADTDPDQSYADAADGRPKKKGNNIIVIQDKTICCRAFSLCLRPDSEPKIGNIAHPKRGGGGSNRWC